MSSECEACHDVGVVACEACAERAEPGASLSGLVAAYNRLATEQLHGLKQQARKLEGAIREFVTEHDTHEPGPFVKDGNWHTGPCVEGGPRMEDAYPHGFQVCADEDCGEYWPCSVERLRRVLE